MLSLCCHGMNSTEMFVCVCVYERVKDQAKTEVCAYGVGVEGIKTSTNPCQAYWHIRD